MLHSRDIFNSRSGMKHGWQWQQLQCTQWREAAGPAGEYLGGGACCLGDGPPLGPDRSGPGEPCPYSPP
ncbi:hypothetical protein NQZ68_039777 [Dissostichus eleginoides]|nr:hypothetical protein NQZ68_008462 [Dissostichus eleginoides]KAI9545049.1 hypothetical protein NQZ68_039777 [Dissostichus eleginoides]